MHIQTHTAKLFINQSAVGRTNQKSQSWHKTGGYTGQTAHSQHLCSHATGTGHWADPWVTRGNSGEKDMGTTLKPATSTTQCQSLGPNAPRRNSGCLFLRVNIGTSSANWGHVLVWGIDTAGLIKKLMHACPDGEATGGDCMQAQVGDGCSHLFTMLLN